jgi:hypothetical protein
MTVSLVDHKALVPGSSHRPFWEGKIIIPNGSGVTASANGSPTTTLAQRGGVEAAWRDIHLICGHVALTADAAYADATRAAIGAGRNLQDPYS